MCIPHHFILWGDTWTNLVHKMLVKETNWMTTQHQPLILFCQWLYAQRIVTTSRAVLELNTSIHVRLRQMVLSQAWTQSVFLMCGCLVKLLRSYFFYTGCHCHEPWAQLWFLGYIAILCHMVLVIYALASSTSHNTYSIMIHLNCVMYQAWDWAGKCLHIYHNQWTAMGEIPTSMQ